jgi:hypothetical protein
MFRRLFQRLTAGATDDSLFQPRMPEVDEPANLSDVCDQARSAAAGANPAPAGSGRHVVIITPGRVLMFQPCPAPDSMPEDQVASIKRLIPPEPQRNIAAISFTELSAVRANAAKAIPFVGMLMGFAYIGHAVWVFEGHPSALALGCREADALLVDGAMVPHLQSDWQAVASSAMRRPEIYVHDRQAFTLRRLRS